MRRVKSFTRVCSMSDLSRSVVVFVPGSGRNHTSWDHPTFIHLLKQTIWKQQETYQNTYMKIHIITQQRWPTKWTNNVALTIEASKHATGQINQKTHSDTSYISIVIDMDFNKHVNSNLIVIPIYSYLLLKWRFTGQWHLVTTFWTSCHRTEK